MRGLCGRLSRVISLAAGAALCGNILLAASPQLSIILPPGIQRGQEHGDQYGDDADDDQEFDEREAACEAELTMAPHGALLRTGRFGWRDMHLKSLRQST